MAAVDDQRQYILYSTMYCSTVVGSKQASKQAKQSKARLSKEAIPEQQVFPSCKSHEAPFFGLLEKASLALPPPPPPTTTTTTTPTTDTFGPTTTTTARVLLH